jgi:hypothetical protein
MWTTRSASRQTQQNPTYAPAILIGYRPLVKNVLKKRPQDVNVEGGFYGTPLHAAFVKKDAEIV